MRLQNDGPAATTIADRAKAPSQYKPANSAPRPADCQTASVSVFPPSMLPLGIVANGVIREMAIQWIVRRTGESRAVAVAVIRAGNLEART